MAQINRKAACFAQDRLGRRKKKTDNYNNKDLQHYNIIGIYN